MRHFSVVVPLLLAFSSQGYGGALRKLFCPTICNPNPKEPLRTCFYKCGFLKYGKYFDGSRCWYFVGTGKIINSKGYCNQGICLKVFTTGYEGSPAQRNCEVHQAKVPSKGETGVKGSKFNVTQASEHGPSENDTKNATTEWHRFSLEPTTPARTPKIPYTKGGLTKSHGGVNVTLGTNTVTPPTGLTTAAPPAEPMTTAPPAELTKAAQAAEQTMFAPTAALMTAAPPAEHMTTAPPAELTKAVQPAEQTTFASTARLTMAAPSAEPMTTAPPAELTMAAPSAELMTTVPPAELTKAVRPAEQTMFAPTAGLTTAVPPEGIKAAAPPAELTTPAPPPTGITTAGPLAELTKAAPPAHLTMAAPPTGLTAGAAPGELTMSAPPAHLTTLAPPTGLTTAAPLAELTAATPPAELTTAVPPPEQTVKPPAGTTAVAPPAQQAKGAQLTELTKDARPAGITTAAPPAQLTTTVPAAGQTTAALLAELTTVAVPAQLTTIAAPAGITVAAPPAGPTTAPPSAKLLTDAPPSGLTEAQASTHDKRNASHSVQATAATSTSREHIEKTTKEGFSLSTLSPETPLSTEESTVPPAAPSTSALSPSSTDRHQKGTSPKEAETSIATTTEIPVSTEQSPTVVLSSLTPTPATERGPSKNYTTKATTQWPGLSLEPTAAATPPNTQFTKAHLSEAHEVATVTLATSKAAPPARVTQAQAPTHDQKNASYSVQATVVTSASKEHINTTAKEGAALSTTSQELALTTEETTVPMATPSTTVLSPGSTHRPLNETRAEAANTSIGTTSEAPVNRDHSSATVLSPLTHAPEDESYSAPRRPAPLEDTLFKDYVATIHSHISSLGNEATKASDKADMTTPINVPVVPDRKNLSEHMSGTLTEPKFAKIVEALSDAGTNWFRKFTGKRPRHEEAEAQAATTPESHANSGASAGSVSQGAQSAPSSAEITKSETQPAVGKIANTTISATLPQATTPPHVAQDVSKGASDKSRPICSMLIALVIIIANYYCFLHNG